MSKAKDTVEEFMRRNCYPAVFSQLFSSVRVHLCLASVFVTTMFFSERQQVKLKLGLLRESASCNDFSCNKTLVPTLFSFIYMIMSL